MQNFKPILFGLIVSLPISTFAQGPITIDDNYVQTNGALIQGTFTGTLTQPAITITTKKPITIANSTLDGPGDLIYGIGSNVFVINTTATGTNPNKAGVRKGMFVHIEQVANLLVANCTIQSEGYPIYVNRYVGNFTPSQTIRIFSNAFFNVDGRMSDGNGGYQTSGNGATHAILLNAQYSVPNIEIAWNEIINQPLQSNVSDIINMYDSSGTSASHILIHDNYAQGAYSVTPGSSETYTGGGIIVDGDTTDTTTSAPAFIDIYNNQVVGTANYGISIAAGHNNSIFNNRVVSSGYASNGVFDTMSFGNGINNYNNYNQASNIFFGNYASNNYSGLIRPDAKGNPMRSDWYLPGQSDNGGNTNFQPNTTASPTLADEQAELKSWYVRSGYFHPTVGTFKHKLTRQTLQELRAHPEHLKFLLTKLKK